MPFTAGYKVNANTQFEFTVSNETISEMVQQEGGIIESDIGAYCYTALIDSRVKKLFAAATYDGGWDGNACNSWANSHCAGVFGSPLSGGLMQRNPMYNKDFLDSDDVCYQRNFLVWHGTIYPDTENAKTGDFLVMDMVDIKRWYINYDSAGFYTNVTVTSAIGETPPEGYVWPGYTGTVCGYTNNQGDNYVMHCDNNDPQLNPNTNIYVKNILVLNDELWIGNLNPSSKGPNQIGSSSYANAANSLYGWYWGASVGATYLYSGDHMYQAHSVAFGALADYSNAPDLPGAPRADIGSLGYNSYNVCANDNIVTRLAGGWGQQNYASSVEYIHSSETTDVAIMLKWQSWCGLKFTYNNVMYKPIIQGGIIVGYTDDMSAESEYDDMTNVTGNNIDPNPPTPPKPTPGHWDDIDSSGAYENVANFIRAYYISGTELQNLRTWMSKTEAEGGAPDGYDFMDAIIGIKAYPFSLASTAEDTIDIVIPNAGEMWMEILQETWIATIAAQLTGQTLPGVPQSITRHVNTGISAMATNCSERHWCLGSIDMSQFTNTQYPFLTYDAAVELYIPYVGTFVLDTQSVMGRTLTAYIYLDPLTGGVYGYCMCGGTMIASGTGNIGIDVPISANQIGLYQAQKDKLRSQAEVGLVTTAATIAAPMVGASMAGSSAAYALANQYRGKVGTDTLNTFARQAYNNAYDRRMANTDVSSAAVATTAQALNANRQIKYLAQSHNMSMTGSIGSSVAEWSCPRDAYIKITRPKAKNPGKNYEHACGVPCYRSGVLNSFKGLTVCIDPDVSGIDATPEERNAIASILSGGVIV